MAVELMGRFRPRSMRIPADIVATVEEVSEITFAPLPELYEDDEEQVVIDQWVEPLSLDWQD